MSDVIRATGLPGIDEYLALDVRLAWRPAANWELAPVGKNLLDPSHLEHAEEPWVVPSKIPRSLTAALRPDL